MARQIELEWRCTSCGYKNLGRHLICQSCGGPKDDSEHYEMPDDTRQAASVTDERLIALATAGANWRCRYCGNDARRRDGSCAQCGAGSAEGRPVGAPSPQRAPAPAPRRLFPSAPLFVALGGGLAVVALLSVCGLVLLGGRSSPARVADEPQYRDLSARVVKSHWLHRIYVDRWQVVGGEGFDEQKPEKAFDVRPLGERVHHVDKVQDGTTTESYFDTETEQVTETYTEQEQCGENCTELPKTCREVCVNNQNGFASCHDECTGGGRSCSPRYCPVTKSRQVPRQKQVQKTRVVPRYKDVERKAAFFSWKVWDWKQVRSVDAEGDDFAPRWPSDERVALNAALSAAEEKERARRFASYSVELLATNGTRHTHSPTTLEEFQRFRGATATLRVSRFGSVELLGAPTPSLSASATAGDAAPAVSSFADSAE